MLRSIGSVTVLALLMVGCGGGGSASPPPPGNYTVGGTVTGLNGSGLVLMFHDDALSGPQAVSLAVPASGGFTFSPAVPQGSTFHVYIGTQPKSPAQDCEVTNGTGAVGTTNVTNVSIACSNTGSYTVGGTVTGLVGSGLALAICRFHGNYGGRGAYFCDSPLQISANGAFTLGSALPPTNASPPDRVQVTQQPSSPTQYCVVGNATIDIQTPSDTAVTVSCAAYSYVTNAADNTLSAYVIDATTGALQAVGTPIATGTSPYATVGVELFNYPHQCVVYVGNEGSNDVSAFDVNIATGDLTVVPGSPFPAGTDPKAMALYGGRELFVANAGSDNVSVYGIDYGTGALIGPSTVATGRSPTSIAVSSLGDVVFVANHGGSNDISAFYVYDGTPVPGSPFPAGGNPLSLALGAGGQFLYSANPDATNPSISGFSIDPTSGVLSPLSGSPFPLPASHYMATDQAGAYLYVTTSAGIVGYGIDATTGALTALPGFPVAAGADAYSVSIDPSNQFLYVANDGAANVSGFRLDTSTGALTPMAGSPFAAGNHPEFLATLFPAQF
jgi:6-phosphogluconolactonase